MNNVLVVLKYTVVLSILYALFAIYVYCEKSDALPLPLSTKAPSLAPRPLVKEKIAIIATPPANSSLKDNMVYIDGVVDSSPTTVTMYVTACGTKLEIIISKAALAAQDPELDKIANEAIDKACR